MVDEPAAEEKFTVPKRPGDRLRAARVAAGLEIADITARTRIPTRHLEAIEANDYSGLPSPTYATGFARSYARAVGLDEVAIAHDVRGEVAQSWNRQPARETFIADDPARTPSRGVVMTALAVAVIALIGAVLWFGTDLLRGTGQSSRTAQPTLVEETTATMAVPEPGGTLTVGSGQVSLTATDAVWVRVYDAAGTTLFMKEMTSGERYDVPADADRPMINTGRPDQIEVSVNGSRVAPLGNGRVAIKDVPIGAAALLARDGGTAPTPDASPTPAASSSRSTNTTAAPRERAATPTPRPTPRATASPSSSRGTTPPARTSTNPLLSITPAPPPPPSNATQPNG